MAERPFFERMWGEATAALQRSRKLGWVDLLVIVSLAGLFYGLIDLGREFVAPQQAAVEIESSPWALPRYTFFSLCRGLLAYSLSLLFTLTYGYWAAKDKMAERVLIPLLDIMQSIPVLGFLPGVLLALQALFPTSNVGVQLASVIMVFTGQAWNMTFSFYHSVISVPLDQREVATIYRFSWWERFKWVELPFSMIGLVWNSMMSMAGGWFFLAICESTTLKDNDFRVPGLGSYMSQAVKEKDYGHMAWAVLAMALMVILIDQLLWRPVVVWAQKFRVEEGGAQEEMTSWFLNWMRRSRIVGGALAQVHRWTTWLAARRAARRTARPAEPMSTLRDPTHESVWTGRISLAIFVLLLLGMLYGAWQLVELLRLVTLSEWGRLGGASMLTLSRVLLSTLLGTLWAVPAGLAIGLSPRLSRALQPVVQVVSSFPAPMLFPLVFSILLAVGITLNWGSVFLMLMGTQWYILFNVIAGAMAIPADLKEAARSYGITGWQRMRVLYLPAIFPYLVTGWVTAAGGAWNASIVSEYMELGGLTEKAWGLGAEINIAAADSNFPLLAASVLVMSALVVIFNRTVWRRLYKLAEGRYSLSR